MELGVHAASGTSDQATQIRLWIARRLFKPLSHHDSASFAEGAEVFDVLGRGIDLGKASCSVVELDAIGKVVGRRRMRHETVVTYAAILPTCVIKSKPGAVHITWDVPWCGEAMHYE